ncbi:OB-fold nucleic acid binding domain-containing protein [Knoellia sp. p5-6-4]|uniref:OB-fold nucleic acid binding domain-containing protein n=1 Tax=unclassified Knoellia TaxID=2618719 RepID=UPI0023DA9F36|nr:OB-fold nucleic acid binding domain-containing protein [Knoellia sp. p5-6-4]MDF2143586.1 OB-fold nucleic acid binding domain-containing protein [Knoellia sp. p5-6-4]
MAATPASSGTSTADGHHRSLLGRLGERLTRTAQQIEAAELQEDTARHGATRMSDLKDRQVATVTGTVRAVTLRPRVNVPALVVDLYDGSRTINLIWLGRRTIGGIEPGTYLRATGRVTYLRGMPTIFNPAYEIVPSRGH